MKKVRIALLVLALLAALSIAAVPGLANTGPQGFIIGNNSSAVFDFTVNTTGTLNITASWLGVKLALILNGPGQTGYYQRVEGNSPLSVNQYVSARILARGSNWRAKLVNFGVGGAIGTLNISFSAQPEPVRHYTQFDRLNIVSIDKTMDHAAVEIEYTLQTYHSRAVYLGMEILANGRQILGFSSSSPRIDASNGRLFIDVYYNDNAFLTSDQIAVFLYEDLADPFAKLTSDLRLDWLR